jgi:hypothetical protein
MIAIHFGAIYFTFESVSARLEPKDQIAVVMILSPLTATFVTLFLKDLVKPQNIAGGTALEFSLSFSGVTVLLTILYGLTIFFILINFLKNQDVGPDMLKLYIGVIETVIGSFVVMESFTNKTTQRTAVLDARHAGCALSVRLRGMGRRRPQSRRLALQAPSPASAGERVRSRL